jgi:hypothetical protein
MATLLPTFSVTLSQRRWTCVLDPLLALSPLGLPLTKQLGQVMELWIVRELWHILDNTHFYLQYSEGDRPPSTKDPESTALQTLTLDEKALRDWDASRTEIDMTGLNVFWVGDALGQSLLPEGMKPDIVQRYERFAAALDLHIQQQQSPKDLCLSAATRDAAALVAALTGAIATPTLILTQPPQPSPSGQTQPCLCTLLQQWGIPCQALDDQDPMVAIERDYLRHLFVHAGLSQLVWAGLQLAVLHLSIPSASSLALHVDDEEDINMPELVAMKESWEIESDSAWETPETNLWVGAQGFWYFI